MKYQKKNLHQHSVWTNLWPDYRERILSIWSRRNLEGQLLQWNSLSSLPSVFISGEKTYGDSERWTSEARAIREASLWER